MARKTAAAAPAQIVCPAYADCDYCAPATFTCSGCGREAERASSYLSYETGKRVCRDCPS